MDEDIEELDEECFTEYDDCAEYEVNVEIDYDP
jgi:hypothetical protein